MVSLIKNEIECIIKYNNNNNHSRLSFVIRYVCSRINFHLLVFMFEYMSADKDLDTHKTQNSLINLESTINKTNILTFL